MSYTDFDGIEDTKDSAERLPKLTPGEYELEVITNKVIQTQKGRALLSEFKILSAAGEGALSTGTTASCMTYFNAQFAKDKMGAYFRALLKVPKVFPADAAAIVSPANPAKGEKITVRVTEAVAKASGNTYKKYAWKSV